MGEILYMPMMSLREYARHRKSQGLLGGSGSAVHKALVAGRITRGADGRIDSEKADAAWLKNTAERATDIRLNGAESAPDDGRWNANQWAAFRHGNVWLASRLCAVARAEWPAIVRATWHDMPASDQAELIALVCGALEKWTAEDRAIASRVTGLTCIPSLVGARHMAHQIGRAGRLRFPRLIAEMFGPDGDQHNTIQLVAVVTALCEGWLGHYLPTEPLPAIDWVGVLVGGSAAAADQEYWALRRAYTETPEPVDTG